MKKQLTALLVGLSVASLTIAAPVSSVKPASQAKKAPVKKASKKKQKREAKILLRAKPNNKAKIVGRVSVDQQLVPFYKKGDWLKVGDPGNGKVAWFNEKHRVWFIRMSSLERVLMASSPWMVLGILTTTFGAQVAISLPSSTIPWTSVLRTSAEMGPSTVPAISWTAAL